MGFLEVEDKVVFNKSYSETFEAVIKSISELGWKLKSENKELGRIQCGTGVNMITFGENIDIKIEKNGKKTTLAAVSAPKTGAAFGGLFSTSKSRDHINKLFEKLGEKLK